MDLGKKLASVLLGILLVYLLLCILGPKDLNVERTTSINAAPQEAFEMVNNLQNWEKWSPWYARDPEMKIEYTDVVSGKGAKYAWDGEKTGKGSLEIVDAKAGELVKTKLQFDGFDGASFGTWEFTPEGNNTKVSWGMAGDKLPFMLRGMMFVMRQKQAMTKDFDEGLSNLKKLLEA